MMSTNFKRVAQAGFFGFVRNSFVSLASIFTMLVTLSVIMSLMFGGAILNTTLAALKDKVDLNVYFVRDAQEQDVLAMKKSIEALPEVASVTYISQAQALENFRERHKNDQYTLAALDELDHNPLGATFNVKTKEPSQYEGLAQFLQTKTAISGDSTQIIDKVNYFQNKTAIDKLIRIINASDKVGFVAMIVLIAISILITFNTIRLVIFMSRDEISVMRLVGASSFYTRGPFVVTGILCGFTAALATLVLFYPLTLSIGHFTENFFIGFNLFDYYTSHFGQLFVVVMGSGIVIGAISSYLAVRKYLRA